MSLNGKRCCDRCEAVGHALRQSHPRAVWHQERGCSDGWRFRGDIYGGHVYLTESGDAWAEKKSHDEIWRGQCADRDTTVKTAIAAVWKLYVGLSYQGYLETDAWREVRNRILRRDDFRCVRCSSTKSLQVHHLTYQRLGCEHDNDLVTLCRTCHHGLETS